jgi:Bacterial Ig-like domain
MTLRTSGDTSSATGPRHRHFRLPVALVGAVVFLLTALAGGTGAGVSSYQGTLYLDGAASTVSGSTWQITTSAGPGTPTTPTTVGVPGGGTLAAASYQYIYVRSSGSGRTASPISTPPVAVAANGAVNVSVSPAELGGDLYRARVSSGLVLGNYVLVSPAGGVTTVPFTDTGAIVGAALPQADNRILPNNTTGWTDFTPGAGLATTLATSAVSGTAPSLPATCRGWTVDAAGGMSFPASPWTFQVRVKPGSTAAGNGLALLSAGMWKVNDAGSTVGGYLLAPTDGDVITNATGTATNATVTGNPGAFTLNSGEHLCVQFWRHQTLGYTSGSAANHSISLLAYDPANQITVHPAPNAFASAALSVPADALHTTSVPQLGATYSDTEGDAGTLTIKLCTDAGCSASPENSGALAATNGATLNWTPTGPLADGTYWWEAQAQDALGLPSPWTAARTFVIDNVAPTTNITSSPPALSNIASGSFSFTANETVTGYVCRVDGASFAACSSPDPYGPLADGAHSFDVKAAADLAGNPGTTTNYGWTIDTLAGDTSITSQPSSLSNSSSPSFGLSATEPGSTFECSLDGAAFAPCTNPKTYSGVADGAHTFQVRSLDPAGNVDPSPDSYSWTIDATPPNTTIGPGSPSALTTATGATFDFSSNESPSTFACALDAGAYSACSTPKTYSGLADGAHTFSVRGTDSATNTDPTPASYSWTVDTTPPSTIIGPTMPPANTQSSGATFDLGSNEPGSTFECRLDGALFVSCTTPASYAGLGDGTHTFDVRATDPVGNLDTSPATYSWKIDNVAPSSPTLTSPADALATSALPQLRATFNDATAGGDTGTVEFQLCSSSAPAGSACAPVVQSVTSGSVSNGGTASATPAALADGTYHWQARAHDVAGNQSGWSATRSFQLDTSVPAVPVSATPADGAWVRAIQLSAPFNKPAFSGTGTVEFRVCSDPLCLGIVRSGGSGTLVNGALATWSPSSLPVDGLYYWQARATDSVGNVSAWTPSRTLHLDRVAPAKPVNFSGQVAFDGLTLRWSAPNDDVANYVVFVDGKPWKNFGSTEFEVKMGTFDSGDPRSFSVVAVDLAGNVGTMSAVLVGVPNLVGLTWPQALGATTARGLGLRRNAVFFAAIPMIVAKQDPSAPALTERGTAVVVTMSPASGAPLAVNVKPGRFACAAGSVLRLRVDLSGVARVRTRLLNGHGRVVKLGQLGILRAGTSNVRVKLPAGLGRGAYRLMLDATGQAGTAHALVRVKVGSRACRAH